MISTPLGGLTAPNLPSDAVHLRDALRKASRRLLPLLAVCYGVSYMDRINISFASLQMNRDLHFGTAVYGFGAGLFFLSYAACEVPSNLLLVRVGARRWIARIMLTWGILSAAMIFVRTPGEFYGLRFLLGMAEAGFVPGAIYYLSQWFPPEMRARAVSRFWLAIPLSSALMSSIAAALLSLQGRLGLAGWQWLFLIEAAPAIVLSLIVFGALPDGPAEAKWLSPQERSCLVIHLRSPETTENIGRPMNLRDALVDRRVLLIGLSSFCVLLCTYAYNFSAPAIIIHLSGLSVGKVGLIMAAYSLTGAVIMVLNGMHSDRQGERYLHYIIPCLVMAGGFLCGGLFHSAPAAIPALALAMIAYSPISPQTWAIATSFLKGRAGAAGIATINTIGIIGGFVGPYWMGLAREITGNYQTGIMLLSIPALLAALVMLYLRREHSKAGVSAFVQRQGQEGQT